MTGTKNRPVNRTDNNSHSCEIYMGGEEQLMDKQIKQRVHTESNMRFGMEKKPAGKRTRKSKVGQRLGFNTSAQ